MGWGSMKYSYLLFLIFLYSASTQTFIIPFLQRLTLPQMIQGGLNNGMLGLFYYHFFYKGKQREKANVHEFIKNTAPWIDAPVFLERYKPRIFIAGNPPTQNPFSPSLMSHAPYYIIDGTLYISHRLLFEYQRGSYSDQDLYSAIRFEYERQSKLSAIQSESTQPFLNGVAKIIAIKKVGSKVLYPTFRPWLNQKGIEFFLTYPKLVFWSLVDLCTKFSYGFFSFEKNRKNKYMQSRIDVLNHWKEVQNKSQGIKD